MDYGIFIFATDKAIPALDLGPEVEARGFDSFWVPEHVHMPVRRETPFPGDARRVAAGAVLPLPGSVHAAGRGRGQDDDAEGRHRHLPGHRA